MIIKVLVDNLVRESGCFGEKFGKLCGEWGFSVYVEFNGKKFLLDTGASKLFVRNAAVMGIDLSQIDVGILSHAHYDHANGMSQFFKENHRANFYLRRGTSENCYHVYDVFNRFNFHKYIGIKKGTLRRFKERIHFVEGISEIAQDVYLLPHQTKGLERIGEMAHLCVKENGIYRADDFSHEQSLVFDTPSGLLIINSCSHGGADNIIKEVSAAFPSKKIFAVLGGFHLHRYAEEQVRRFAFRLKELDVQKIYTGHCTGERAYDILHQVLGNRVEQLFTGMTIEL